MAVVVKPKVIELSEAAYDEIEQKLLDAGYDFLVWPRGGMIAMDGFKVIRHVPEGHVAHHWV